VSFKLKKKKKIQAGQKCQQMLQTSGYWVGGVKTFHNC